MLRISHVMCAVDFSDFSVRALDYSVALAREYAARLTVVHVFSPAPTIELSPAAEEEVEQARALGALARMTASLPSDVPVQLRAEGATGVARTLARLADEQRANLLVVGSHGRTGFERVMLGSVSEKLIRVAPCPTLVVPRRAPDRQNGSAAVRRILAAVDFSEPSLRALEYAMTMAEGDGRDLTVVHVHPLAEDLAAAPSQAMAALLRTEIESDWRRVDQLVPAALREAGRVQTLVRSGTVYREILATASDPPSDLIVMGVHGHGAIDLMIFGSNTGRVVRGATCPVLIVPRASH